MERNSESLITHAGFQSIEGCVGGARIGLDKIKTGARGTRTKVYDKLSACSDAGSEFQSGASSNSLESLLSLHSSNSSTLISAE